MLIGGGGGCVLQYQREREIVKSIIIWSYPEVDLCGRRLWNSTSSTVQTAPLTFSTRMKHLCSDRLWRTAFYSYYFDWFWFYLDRKGSYFYFIFKDEGQFDNSRYF